MRQKMNRLLALLLTVTLCLSLAFPAWAADTESSAEADAIQSEAIPEEAPSAGAESTSGETSEAEPYDADSSIASDGTDPEAAAESASGEESAPNEETGEDPSEMAPAAGTDPADIPSPALDEEDASGMLEAEASAEEEEDADPLVVTTDGETTVVTVTLDSEDEGYGNASLLRSAISYASSESPLLIKISQKGTYQVARDLEIRSNTTLDLNGSTLVRAGEVGNLIQNTSLDCDQTIGGYSLSYDITVKNGTLDGSGGSTAMSNLVNIGHATGVTFSGVTFKNAVGSHLLELAGCKDAVVKNCTFTGYTPTDSADETAEAIQLDICASSWNGIYTADSTVCKNITVTGCSFQDYPSGVGNHHTIKGNHSSNITISNNTFTNTRSYETTKGVAISSPAIWCFGFDNSTVSGNTISGNYGYGIRISAGSVNVRKNTLGSSKAVLTYQPIDMTVGGSCKSADNVKDRVDEKVTGGCVDSNVIYSKCSSSCKYQDSIRIYSSTLSSVSSNKIYSSSGRSISLSKCTVSKVNSNRLTSKAQEALYLTGCKVKTVDGNTVSSSKNNGISLNSSTKVSTSVNKNTVSSCKGHGIYLSKSSTPNLSSNKISSCKKSGIYLASKSSATKVCSNTIKSCTECGLYVCSSATVKTVQKNTITGCRKYGIQVANKSLKKTTITKNTLKGNKKAIKVSSKNKKYGNVFQTK